MLRCLLEQSLVCRRRVRAVAASFRPIAAAARAKARAIFPAQAGHRSREQRLLAHFVVQDEHAAIVADHVLVVRIVPSLTVSARALGESLELELARNVERLE